jgi:D-alanyl-D-alanine carboxypeptidase
LFLAQGPIYRDGLASAKEGLYRIETYMKGAVDAAYPAGKFPQPVPPLRLKDTNVLNYMIASWSPVKPCATSQDNTREPPPEPAEQGPPLPATLNCNNGRVAYAVTQIKEIGGKADSHDIIAACPDMQIVPASITKLLTLIVALDALEEGKFKLDAPVKISRHAASQEGSKLGLKAGQTLTFQEAVEAVAIKSAGDVAFALGEFVAGDERTFAKLMEKKAKDIGMERSTFSNDTGLPREEFGVHDPSAAKPNLSTIHDIEVLMQTAMTYKVYKDIATKSVVTIDGITFHDHNPLVAGALPSGPLRCLTAIPGAKGGKTGLTNDGADNVVFIALKDGSSLIVTYIGARTPLERDVNIGNLLNEARKSVPEIPSFISARVKYDTRNLPHCVR